LLLKRIAIASPIVPPCLDGVAMIACSVRRKLPAPTVIADQFHRCPVPLVLICRTPENAYGDVVVTVHEDVGFHGYGVADRALHRKATLIHSRRDVLDRYAGCLQRLCHAFALVDR